ncbi:hypothetical protein [Pseudonocardia phyllosphaerae]|uniref:hypothetical protein n=1 Tax=Pseudonocardia phyllosphaerae TaxID=3390502 RepID=UPI00397924BF
MSVTGTEIAAQKRAEARRDAVDAVQALAEAGRIVGGQVVGSVGSVVSSGTTGLSGRVEGARSALAEAIDPSPEPVVVAVRRWPWIVALIAVTGLAVWGWATVLRRERPIDPGTPVSTVPPSDEQLEGKPVGRAPTTRTTE